MAYASEVEINDLKTVVENIRQKFSNLSYNVLHEAVYGIGRVYFFENCEELLGQNDKAEVFQIFL